MTQSWMGTLSVVTKTLSKSLGIGLIEGDKVNKSIACG